MLLRSNMSTSSIYILGGVRFSGSTRSREGGCSNLATGTTRVYECMEVPLRRGSGSTAWFYKSAEGEIRTHETLSSHQLSRRFTPGWRPTTRRPRHCASSVSGKHPDPLSPFRSMRLCRSLQPPSPRSRGWPCRWQPPRP